jgi:ribosomal protein S18 acetylase RimI-like enzyme
LRARALDCESVDAKEACQAFDFGPEDWSRDVRKWLAERLWLETPHDRGHTIIFSDAGTGVDVGYVTWRIRKLRLPHDNKQRKVIELHYIGIVPDYRGEKCTGGESVASQMFATAEAAARADTKARPDMPVVLEVEVENTHAREVYVEGWGFEHLGFRKPTGDRRYEVLARAATEPADDTRA